MANRYSVTYMSNIFILLLLWPNILLYLLVLSILCLVSPCYYPYILLVPISTPIMSSYIPISTCLDSTNQDIISTSYSVSTTLPVVSLYFVSVYYPVTTIISILGIFIYSSPNPIVYLNSIVLSVSGLLLSLVCCIYWIRDGIREYTSTYMSVIVLISVSLLGILVSESILFATLFWSLFQPFCSYLYSLEGVYTSDPSSHTYSNTIILSNSGVSLGCVLVIRDVYRLHLLLPLYVWIIALTFLHIQIEEFSGITLYMNESIYVSMFFSLLGLHLFHILIGILLIGLIVWTSCYSRSVLTFTSLQLIVSNHQLSSTLQLVYWHFVDLLWLIIYYVLYN